MGKNLLVMQSEDQAKQFKKLFGLGEDWKVSGYFGQQTGNQFDRIIFIHQTPKSKKESDSLPEWINVVLRTRLRPENKDGLIIVNGLNYD